MAAVVSHAMRRFPPSPPDVYSSYELRVSRRPGIVSFQNRINPTPLDPVPGRRLPSGLAGHSKRRERPRPFHAVRRSMALREREGSSAPFPGGTGRRRRRPPSLLMSGGEEVVVDGGMQEVQGQQVRHGQMLSDRGHRDGSAAESGDGKGGVGDVQTDNTAGSV